MRHRITRSFFILTMFFAFTSCGEKFVAPLTSKILNSTQYQSKSNPFLGEVIFVVHGGFNSCGEADDSVFGLEPLKMDFYPQFSRLIQQIKTQFEHSVPRVLVGCLSADSPLESLSYFRWNNQAFTEKIQSKDIFPFIEEERLDKNSPVFFIGHSYGGWLVMDMVSNAKAVLTVGGLFTIDPISPMACTPSTIFSEAAGCFRSPTDLDNQKILKNTYAWHNFYQTSDPWLQSSPIDVKGVENYEFFYLSGGHRIIDTDERIWGQINYSVLNYLQKYFR